MKPGTHQNRKARINLECPTCGMSLTDPKVKGYIQGTETFCCKGCADGTGCTCKKVEAPKAYNRPGSMGRRNPENSLRDKNFNQEVTSSGEPLNGSAKKGPKKFQTRGQALADGRKRARSQSEERPSTREQARGRSELTGAMNKRLNRSGAIDRRGRTGTKSD